MMQTQTWDLSYQAPFLLLAAAGVDALLYVCQWLKDLGSNACYMFAILAGHYNVVVSQALSGRSGSYCQRLRNVQRY
jgi:hypothetical protein